MLEHLNLIPSLENSKCNFILNLKIINITEDIYDRNVDVCVSIGDIVMVVLATG